MGKGHFVIVTSYPVFDEPVIRNRMTAYVNVLSNAGWKITIVAPNSQKIPDSAVADHLPGCEIKCIAKEDCDRRNFMVRGFHELRQSWRLLRIAASLRPDVVMTTIPTIFLLLFALRPCARVHVADVRDLVWEYLPRRPWWNGIVRGVLRMGALLALRRAAVIAVSNPYQLRYMRRHVRSKRSVLVSNGIGRKQFNQINSLKHEPRSNGVLRVTYIGNVGIAQNLTTLVDAVAGIAQLHVNIIGCGTDFERVRTAVKERAASNVCLHGPMLWEEAIHWYSRSDVLYAQLQPAFSTAMPSKLYEYLATGLPVVYGGNGVAAQLLTGFSGVTIVEPNSPERLRLALLKMSEEHAATEQLAANIDCIQSSYIRENHVAAIENIISELSQPSA
ncbi:MAG TPA: glycosyltransferase [Candidatus Acidoferrum sp.]|nr:glycosyltransferase [Candidatus Acidoferrum sp.]